MEVIAWQNKKESSAHILTNSDFISDSRARKTDSRAQHLICQLLTMSDFRKFDIQDHVFLENTMTYDGLLMEHFLGFILENIRLCNFNLSPCPIFNRRAYIKKI